MKHAIMYIAIVRSIILPLILGPNPNKNPFHPLNPHGMGFMPGYGLYARPEGLFTPWPSIDGVCP